MNCLDTRLNEYGRDTRIEEEIQNVVVMVRKHWVVRGASWFTETAEGYSMRCFNKSKSSLFNFRIEIVVRLLMHASLVRCRWTHSRVATWPLYLLLASMSRSVGHWNSQHHDEDYGLFVLSETRCDMIIIVHYLLDSKDYSTVRGVVVSHPKNRLP